MTENLGDEQAKKLISEAVYFFSIGSNDYMGGYLGNPKMQQDYNPEQYVEMVIGNLTKAIQVRLLSQCLEVQNILRLLSQCLEVQNISFIFMNFDYCFRFFTRKEEENLVSLACLLLDAYQLLEF